MSLLSRIDPDKEKKVEIDGEKGVQVSTKIKKFQHNNDPRLWSCSPKRLYISFFFYSSSLCSYYVSNMIKSLELRLVVVLYLRKIKFGSAQISATTIRVDKRRPELLSTPDYVILEWWNIISEDVTSFHEPLIVFSKWFLHVIQHWAEMGWYAWC